MSFRASAVIGLGLLVVATAACVPVASKPAPEPPAGPPTVAATCGMTITTSVVLANDMTCSRTRSSSVPMMSRSTSVATRSSASRRRRRSGWTRTAPLDPNAAHSFTLRNGTIAGFQRGVSGRAQYVPNTRSRHATIDGVHFVGGGVGLNGFDGNTVTHCTFDPRPGETSGGIGVEQKAGREADRFAFNTFNALYVGVSVFQWGGVSIDHNTFVGNDIGVSMARVNGITVADNDFRGGSTLATGGRTGVEAFEDATDLTIADNTMDGLVLGVRFGSEGFGVAECLGEWKPHPAQRTRRHRRHRRQRVRHHHP